MVLREAFVVAAVSCLASACAAPAFAFDRDGKEFQINTYTTGNQLNPSVSGINGGGFVVVWESYAQDGSLFGVYGQTFDDAGDPDSDEFLVTEYTTRDQRRPDVAGLTDGNFVVVWSSNQRDGSGDGVFGQIFDSTGEPQSDEDFRVNTYTTGGQNYPRVAALPDGFVVVWQSEKQDGSDLGIFGQRFTSAAAVSGSEFRVNTYTTGAQRNAAVVSDPTGTFTVLWTSSPASGTGQDGSGAGIFAQRYKITGAANGNEFQVNTITTQDQVRPEAVPWNNGGFVAAWESRGLEPGAESTDGIAAQRRNPDGSMVAAEFQVNEYTTSFQEDVAIASFPGSDMLVVWESHGGDAGTVTPAEPTNGDGVFAHRLSPAGTVVGDDFQVNTYTTNAQQDPRVAALQGGRYVAVWESDLQDGSLGGIFGQMYAVDICGDANSDDLITAQDALKIMRYSTGLGTCTKCVCDADGNGTVKTTDALVVLNASVGDYSGLACAGC